MNDIAFSPDDASRESPRPRRQPAPARRPWPITLIVIWLLLGVVLSTLQIVSLRSRAVALEQQIAAQAAPSAVPDPNPKTAEMERAFAEMWLQFIRAEQSYAFTMVVIHGFNIVLGLVTAVGLWRLKGWARTLLIVVGILSIIAALLTSTAQLPSLWLFLVAIYLLQPGVRALFSPTQRSRLLS